MPQEHDDIEIRSEEVQEILSQPPAWLIRWGITVVFGIVLTIIFLSWIMEYPDVVPAQVTLTTANPPSHVVAKASGKIDLLVEDNELVSPNDVLAIISNPAKSEDVLELDSILKTIYLKLYKNDFDPFSIRLNNNYDLGSIQPDFSAFYRSLQNATRDKKFAADLQRRNVAMENLEFAKLQKRNLESRMEEAKEQLNIAERLFEKEKYLISNDYSDSLQYFASRRDLLNAQQSFGSLDLQIMQAESDIKRAENNLRELEFNNLDDSEVLKNAIKDSFEALENSIYRWKDNYLLTSPIAGRVSLSKFWSDNQNITPAEELLVIIPNNEDIIGRLALPTAGSGKVKVGQKVNIKLDNYPSNDFGMLVGHIKSISSVPREGFYNVVISVPQDMISSYKKEIPFRQEMIGQADIITEDKKLFHRIFNQLREILNKAS